VSFKPEFVEMIASRRAALSAEIAALLPVPVPIVWEIGCGHGHFLARYAAEFPEKRCFGVDMSSPRIARALRKSARTRLSNCHFVRAEAREFLHALPPKVAFEEIWVLFPDPWPKKRHHKNRVMQSEFLEAIASRTSAGARLYFRTDHVGYYETVVAALSGLRTWRPDPEAAWPFEPETVFQALAESYHSLVAVRTSHPARPIETVAPGLPPPAVPTSLA
jgi:tRNA (guanine-N7-)-methyltransferase